MEQGESTLIVDWGKEVRVMDNVVINIDNLELGKMIRVSDVKVENLTILDAKSNSIVSVETSRALREAAAAEAKEAGKK